MVRVLNVVRRSKLTINWLSKLLRTRPSAFCPSNSAFQKICQNISRSSGYHFWSSSYSSLFSHYTKDMNALRCTDWIGLRAAREVNYPCFSYGTRFFTSWCEWPVLSNAGHGLTADQSVFATFLMNQLVWQIGGVSLDRPSHERTSYLSHFHLSQTSSRSR